MDAATDLASKAAQPFLDAGQMGGLVVILALGWFLTAIFAWREIKAKNEYIVKILIDWRLDSVASRESVLKAIDIIAVKGRR